MVKEYLICPVPKPRMTKGDSGKSKRNRIYGMRPPVSRYFAFVEEVRLKKVTLPPAGAIITFYLPMPGTWSEKKKLEHDGQYHQQKPDWDNLGKALCDAIFGEDKHLCDVRVIKRWGREGKIIVDSP